MSTLNQLPPQSTISVPPARLPAEIRLMIYQYAAWDSGCYLQIFPGGGQFRMPDSNALQYNQHSRIIPSSQTTTEFPYGRMDANNNFGPRDIWWDSDRLTADRRKAGTALQWFEPTDRHDQISDALNLRRASRETNQALLDAAKSVQIPIFIAAHGMPVLSQLKPYEREIAKNSEVVVLRFGTFDFISLAPFLNKLPNNRYLVLPTHKVVIRLDPATAWDSRRLVAGVQAGDTQAHQVILKTVRRFPIPNFVLQQGRRTKILVEVIVENWNEDLNLDDDEEEDAQGRRNGAFTCIVAVNLTDRKPDKLSTHIIDARWIDDWRWTEPIPCKTASPAAMVAKAKLWEYHRASTSSIDLESSELSSGERNDRFIAASYVACDVGKDDLHNPQLRLQYVQKRQTASDDFSEWYDFVNDTQLHSMVSWRRHPVFESSYFIEDL